MEGNYELHLESHFEEMDEFFGDNVVNELVEKRGWTIGIMGVSESPDENVQRLIDEYMEIIGGEHSPTEEQEEAVNNNEFNIWILEKDEHGIHISSRPWQKENNAVRNIESLTRYISDNFPSDVLDFIRKNSPSMK